MDVHRKNWKLLYSTVGNGSRWASSPVKDKHSKQSVDHWVSDCLPGTDSFTFTLSFLCFSSSLCCQWWMNEWMNVHDQTSAPAPSMANNCPLKNNPLYNSMHRPSALLRGVFFMSLAYASAPRISMRISPFISLHFNH